MRLIFCGTGDIGLPSLKALAKSPQHDIAGVITQPDRPAGRGKKTRMSSIKAEALACGLPVLQPERIRDDGALRSMEALRAEVMVVAAYGQILPPGVLKIPTFGCLNLHASILPRHRGASPIQAAIAAGDSATGMTIMYMDEGLDTGDILLIDELAIAPRESAGELQNRLAALAPRALFRALDLISRGTAPRTPQDAARATYAPKLSKADGFVDWTLPAVVLERHVRAMSPRPGAFARLADPARILKIHKASLSPGSGLPGCILAASETGISVATGEGCLVLEEVQLEGRKRLNAGEFLRGVALPVGTRFDLSFPVGIG